MEGRLFNSSKVSVVELTVRGCTQPPVVKQNEAAREGGGMVWCIIHTFVRRQRERERERQTILFGECSCSCSAELVGPVRRFPAPFIRFTLTVVLLYFVYSSSLYSMALATKRSWGCSNLELFSSRPASLCATGNTNVGAKERWKTYNLTCTHSGRYCSR